MDEVLRKLQGKVLKDVQFNGTGQLVIEMTDGTKVTITRFKRPRRWYVVGIMPLVTENPDPDYWLDRFEAIYAWDEEEAVAKWIQMREGWLRPDEKRYIRIWDILNDEPVGWDWKNKYKEVK